MRDPYIIGWSILLFTSIAWYAFLVFYIGIKAGKELLTLIKHLAARQTDDSKKRRDQTLSS